MARATIAVTAAIHSPTMVPTPGTALEAKAAFPPMATMVAVAVAEAALPTALTVCCAFCL